MRRLDTDTVREMAEQYGTPLYLYDMDLVTDQAQALQRALPDGAGVYYSLKANPLPSLVQCAVDAGCRLEITSPNELAVAAGSVNSMDHVLYGGPGKTEDEIHEAIRSGVRLFSLESWTDMERLYRVAREQRQQVQALLRVNPSEAVASGLAMSGAATQFGFSEEELTHGRELLERFNDGVSVIGFHVYYGTQIASVEKIAESVEFAIGCIERLCEACDLHPKMLDLGGGFPWPYGKDDEPPSLEGLKEALTSALSRRRRSAQAAVWFESGRYISAPSGTLVATVLDIKKRPDGNSFLVLDTGINHLGGMTGLGRLPRAGFQFRGLQLSSGGSEPAMSVSVVGPLCSPLDCLARQSKVPESTRAGDLLTVPNVGAYGLTASLLGFLSRPAPLEIAIQQGHPTSIHQWRHGHDRVQVASANITLTEETV